MKNQPLGAISEPDREVIRAEVERALKYLAIDLGIPPAAVLSVAHYAVLATISVTFGNSAALYSSEAGAELMRDVIRAETLPLNTGHDAVSARPQ